MTNKLSTLSVSMSFTLLAASISFGCDSSEVEPDCGDECTTLYAERGELSVGTSSRQHGNLQVRSWYPSTADAEEDITYTMRLQFPGFPDDPVPVFGHAQEDADVRATKSGYPLVVLSHGFGLNPEWYAPLGEHLASHGFFVVAPQHRESDWASDVIDATAIRPLEVSAAIDFALEAEYAGFIDAEQVGVVGHSYGGYTALAAGGARIDYDALESRCQNAEDDFEANFLCPPFLEGKDELASAMGLDSAPAGLWPSLADERINAIVPIAGDAFVFGAEGLGALSVPMLSIGGTADTASPWEWGSALAFELAGSSDKRLVGLEGGDHFLPMADCQDMPWMESMPDEFRIYLCEDPVWSKADAHALIQHFTTAFLLEVLKKDAMAAESLLPFHYEALQNGVSYERSEF